MKSEKKKPKVGIKQLFLIDGLGAILTALMLYVVLPAFGEYFQMPPNTLRFLSAIACILAIYSLCCYFFLDENRPLFLRIIGIGNLLYCLLTVAFLINYYHLLTTLDFIYFTVEIIIISGLAFIEIAFFKQNNKPEEPME